MLLYTFVSFQLRVPLPIFILRKDKRRYGRKVTERIIELLEFFVVENRNYITISHRHI